MNIPVIAFKAKNKDRFLCDGLECVDWEDELGDVADIHEALLVIRKDFSKPDKNDVDDFYNFISELPLSYDVQFIKDNYDPVDLEITKEELTIVRQRNQF